MHTHESALENYNERRQTTKDILTKRRSSHHEKHKWQQAVHRFIEVNFAELEARIIKHHMENSQVNPDRILPWPCDPTV